jgi:excinuclease ABC subunit A
MSERAKVDRCIRLRGVRHNNLKNFDLDLPLHRLIVVTGLSGSGKSSLAFDTLFAEGQRRYIETFSPYARQFFDRMDKPRVDRIEGIPPAIAIEQRNTVRTTRSTVGTMTEICDHLKLLWPHLAQLYCRQCGQPVRREPPAAVWEALAGADRHAGADCLITFDLPLSAKLSLADSLELVARQGYRRLLVRDEVCRIEDAPVRLNESSAESASLTVVQDRLTLLPGNRRRFIEACEQAYHFGKGRLTVRVSPKRAEAANAGDPATEPGPSELRFSSGFHCARCDLDYREPTPALFSFNHPLGACPACKGFGRIIGIDYARAIPDRSLSLAAGAVKPWRSGFSAECQRDLARFCRVRGVPMNVPFARLSAEHQRWVTEGDPDYGVDEEHQWPRSWYGVKGYFRWLESKAYKMHVRVLLSRYRAYTPCPQCGGRRFNADALLFRCPWPGAQPPAASTAGDGATVASLTLADFYALPISEALGVVAGWQQARAAARRSRSSATDPLALLLAEVYSRLAFLAEVGLGYLTLDRPTRTLSGGETERVNLTTCLGSRLVNTLFVLDEPSVGLHPRDTERLVRILQRLRDAGNTVLVVEHEAAVMRAADQILDLGPGHGEGGGHLVFQGPMAGLLRHPTSLTGQYLSGRKRIECSARRPVAFTGSPAGAAPRWLSLAGVTRHNLRDLSVEVPLGRFVCVTGVSGSGKSTLIRDVLFPAVQAALGSGPEPGPEERWTTAGDADDEDSGPAPASVTLRGHEALGRVVLVDQSSLGKTPRSNPAVYVGAFDDLRELFAASPVARERGLNASAFSFNSAQGQCERCRGAGFERIEMQFLSDVLIRCPDCDGRRYREHILEVKIAPESTGASAAWSVGDLLEATVDDALDWLAAFGDSRPARRAAAKLAVLREIGLGYLRLGQPINTLSGGECQRLKLAAHLADPNAVAGSPAARNGAGDAAGRPTLFLFDEPTTGLHFEDVRVLVLALQRLVDAGHSVLVIEHNLELIRCADWVIDLGPEAGEAGGRVVATGTPEEIAACPASHTGRALRQLAVSIEAPARRRRSPGKSAHSRSRSPAPDATLRAGAAL